MKNAAAELHPLGKVLTMPGLETDDEDGNDIKTRIHRYVSTLKVTPFQQMMTVMILKTPMKMKILMIMLFPAYQNVRHWDYTHLERK